MGLGELKTSPADKLIIFQLGHLLKSLLAKCQKTNPRVGEGRNRSADLEEGSGHQKERGGWSSHSLGFVTFQLWESCPSSTPCLPSACPWVSFV